MNLLIGYGNTLRADDGVGPAVAQRIAGRRPDTAVLTPFQLLPEHAEEISKAARVIFIDATAVSEPGAILTLRLTPDLNADLGKLHQFAPQTLLAYAELLYGHAPPAQLVTVGGYSFAHSDCLTPQMETRLDAVETAVLALLDA